MILAALLAASAATGGYCQPSDRSAAQTVDAWVAGWNAPDAGVMRAAMRKDAVLNFYDDERPTPEDWLSRVGGDDLVLLPIKVFKRRVEGVRVTDDYTSKKHCMPAPRLVLPNGDLAPSVTMCSDPTKPDLMIQYQVAEGCITGVTIGFPQRVDAP